MCPRFCHRDAGKGRCRTLFGPAHGMRIWNPEWVPAAPPVALSPWGRSDSYFASVVRVLINECDELETVILKMIR